MERKIAGHVVRDVRIKSRASITVPPRGYIPERIVVVHIFSVIRDVRRATDKTVLGRCSLPSDRPHAMVFVSHHGAHFFFFKRTGDDLEGKLVANDKR